MATGLEVGAAIGGILQISVELSRLYIRFHRSFKKAPEEVRRLKGSLPMFSEIFHYFSETMSDMSQRDIELVRDSRTENLLVDVSNVVKERIWHIKQVIKRLKALHNEHSSRWWRFGARLMWIICDERDLNELLASLEPIKLSIAILGGIFNSKILMSLLDKQQNHENQISKQYVQKM